jgi:hypothetical protein
MSFDLVFAKPRRKIARNRVAELYDALIRGKPGDAFEALPVENILNALREAYEDFEPAVKFPMIQEGRGSAEVCHTNHEFTFCFRGETAGMQERIIGILSGFGCPVYDPQSATLSPLDEPLGDPVRVNAGGWTPPLKNKAENEAKLAEIQARAEEIRRRRRDENREWYEPVEKLAAQIAHECATGRWQRLGIHSETCAAVLHNMILMNRQSAGPDDILALSHNVTLIWLAHLEAIPPAHEFSDALTTARRGVAKVIEYFYGAWRDGYREFPYSKPMSMARTRTKLNWIKPYREGLLMALYADDDGALRRLIAWPDTDLPVDDGFDGLTKGDNLAQIALAFLFRGEPEKKTSQVVETLRASKRKRANVFWAAAEAIAGENPRAFAARLQELCELSGRSAFKRPDFPGPLIDGSILWHLARRFGLALPELPVRFVDWIIRLPQEGGGTSA